MTGEPPTPGPDEVRLGPYPAGEVGLDDVGLAVVAMLAALGVTSAVSAVRFTPRQSSPPVLQVVLRVGVLLVVVTVVVVVAHELLHWTTASLFGYQPQFEAGVSWLGLELALAFPDELRLRRHELVVMLAPQLVTVAGVAIQLWGPRSLVLAAGVGTALNVTSSVPDLRGAAAMTALPRGTKLYAGTEEEFYVYVPEDTNIERVETLLKKATG